MDLLVNYNGKVIGEGEVCISPNNRSFRYGDGFFETVKIINGKIILQDLHIERIFRSLELLQFKTPTHFSPSYVLAQIKELAVKNGHNQLARIRCTFFRGEGGPHESVDHTPNFIIQSWPLKPEINSWKEKGLSLSIYKDARKNYDLFSSVKNNNYLPYIMASLSAQKQKVDDCIILNSFESVCEASIANVFIVLDGTVITPPLTDGPVDGVMRRHLLQCMRKENIPVVERSITIEELLQASEVFITNSIIGIKWVKQVEKSYYSCQLSTNFFDRFVAPLWKK